ncbi:MAG TPA: hypothetical protein VHU42_18270 [Rhodopila sp.]|nr:hypothetical protein [Rhodopila sp.]
MDGVTVGQLPSGGYVIIPGCGRQPVAFCPCCGADLRTAAAAMALADTYFPLGDAARRVTVPKVLADIPAPALAEGMGL